MVHEAYSRGVPMGADLPAATDGHAPAFVVWATADPNGTPLQRLQVIKGQIIDGKHHEDIFDVACSDGLQPDADTHRCPDNGAAVNLADCSTTAGVGASELKTLCNDRFGNRKLIKENILKYFQLIAEDEAFYYVRVLQNPSCRWSTWDAIRAGVAPRSDLPKTLQERAWSSPIWYRPNDEQAQAG